MGFPNKQVPLQQSVQGLGRGSTPLRMQQPRPGRHSQRPTVHDNPTAARQSMHASPPVPQTSYSPITHVPKAQQPVAQLDFLQRLGFFGLVLAMTRSTPDGPVINPTPRRPASTRRRLAPQRRTFAIASNWSGIMLPPRLLRADRRCLRSTAAYVVPRRRETLQRRPRAEHRLAATSGPRMRRIAGQSGFSCDSLWNAVPVAINAVRVGRSLRNGDILSANPS